MKKIRVALSHSLSVLLLLDHKLLLPRLKTLSRIISAFPVVALFIFKIV